METLIILGGALLFFVLLMLSIALHELGHLSFAKLFGVRTTQYMVGFGPTLWSRHKGETEYGLKWIPLGGYIRMIGMLPPRKGDPEGHIRRSSTGRFQGLVDAAREGALEEVRPGDEDRVFYAKKWWQKLIIMFAGPAMNLMLAVIFFAILIMGIGLVKTQPIVSSVSKCTIPSTQVDQQCKGGEPLTPAAAVGLKPGDRFLTYDGTKIDSYTQLQKLIRGSAGRAVPIVVRRDGKNLPLTVNVTQNQLPSLDKPDTIVTVGFLGITPLQARERGGPGLVVTAMGDMTSRTVDSLLHMPQKMVGVFQAAFGHKKRDPNGPIGVVGASRIGGEILASKSPVVEKFATFLMLLAGINFAVGMFNLIPLLPLDGGHMAGALWEGLKRSIARLIRRPDPGYVDVAKALPLTYLMAAVFMVMGALLIYADVFNPIHFAG
ncbi:MAG: peptidase [Actinomycetia bacterium]|nr:peptidase [Actinomycetes bacterium]